MQTPKANRFRRNLAVLVAGASLVISPGPATPPEARGQAATAPAAARAQAVIDRGLAFLKTRQLPDGGWAADGEPPAITALVLRPFVLDTAGRYSTRDAFLRKGYDRLVGFQQPDGGIYRDILANYNTAIAVSTLAAAKDSAYQPQLDRALKFLKDTQWIEGYAGPADPGFKSAEPSKANFQGGWGYNRHGRPDLSNAQFTLQALHDAGLRPDDPAFKNAVAFLARCQNRSESNDQPWAGNDGGFVYSPADGGDSEAEDYTDAAGVRRWRSYGTMTYAGLKSMIYAGLSKDDPRVQGAIGWITKNWTLDENPGMRLNKVEQARHGLFYYFYVFAHALNAYDNPTLTDQNGLAHDWRTELIARATALQQPDGSFVGERRWMEENPTISTAYVLLALQEAQRDLAEHVAN